MEAIIVWTNKARSLSCAVLYPFLAPAKINDDVLRRLQKIFNGLEPFKVEFSHTQWFGDQVLWLAPEPDFAFRQLTDALCREFPDLLPYGGTISDPTPHLTVADGSPIKLMRDAESRVKAQLPIPVHISGVSVMVGSNEIGSWRTVTEIPLTQT